MKLQKIDDGGLGYYRIDPKARARPILIFAGIAVVIAATNAILHPLGPSKFSIVVMLNTAALFTAIFWRRVRARWQLWTLRFRHLVTLDGMGPDTAVVFDAPWTHYLILDPMKTWMRDNLSGRYGIVSANKQTYKTIRAQPPLEHAKFMQRRTFWFSNPNDAFAFKMRWYK